MTTADNIEIVVLDNSEDERLIVESCDGGSSSSSSSSSGQQSSKLPPPRHWNSSYHPFPLVEVVVPSSRCSVIFLLVASSTVAFFAVVAAMLVMMMMKDVSTLSLQQQQQQQQQQDVTIVNDDNPLLPTTSLQLPQLSEPEGEVDTIISIAFIGNSILYFNDFPRFFQQLVEKEVDGNSATNTTTNTTITTRVYQNSCLHGGGSITSLVRKGNSMYPQFATPRAILIPSKKEHDVVHDDDDNDDDDDHPIYDYGACTVLQLLNGIDPQLDDPNYSINNTYKIKHDDDSNNNDSSSSNNSKQRNQNPCRHDPYYLRYAKDYFVHLTNHDTGGQQHSSKFKWDFVFINDNTRNPARAKTRQQGLETIKSFYIPWFQQNPSSIPIFLWTQAYQSSSSSSLVSSNSSSSSSLEDDVANFTSLTYAGLIEYTNLLERALPAKQKPRIVPLGLAYLLVYEEYPGTIWKQLFHSADHKHPSPSGTFLLGCILYYTLFDKMPTIEKYHRFHDDGDDDDDNNYDDDNHYNYLTSYWNTARMMQHPWEPPNPFPTEEVASYLLNVVERIMVHGEKPKTFVDYSNQNG